MLSKIILKIVMIMLLYICIVLRFFWGENYETNKSTIVD